jgi:hypothetical protein
VIVLPPRFPLVRLPTRADGRRENHALWPERTDADKTLCGLWGGGSWDLNGFTPWPEAIDCAGCRQAVTRLMLAEARS